MKVQKLIRLGTPGDKSPAVYATDRGTLLIQGYKVDPLYLEGLEGFAAEREGVVEVPEELIALVSKRK